MDRRKFLGQDPKTGDWGKEFLPETLEAEEYKRQVEAQLKPTRQEWKKMMDLIEGGLTLSDRELWEKMGYSDPKRSYIFENKDDLSREYGDLY